MSQKDLDSSLDGQLEMKKRARRRLVGAAALALLAAIVLPMVMDHEPRQPVQDVQVKIPSQDAGGFTSRILPAKPAPTPLPVDEPPAKPVAKTADVPPSAETAKPTPPAVEKPAEKPVAKPVEKPADKPAEKPAEKAPEKPAAKADETRAAAVLAGGGEQWVVQLGAYKEAGNVKLLLGKLKQMGVAAYTEDFDSPQGPRTRVRAGPFPSKEAAEKAQGRIRKIGVDGPVAPR
jgi:DedD protein